MKTILLKGILAPFATCLPFVLLISWNATAQLTSLNGLDVYANDVGIRYSKDQSTFSEPLSNKRPAQVALSVEALAAGIQIRFGEATRKWQTGIGLTVGGSLANLTFVANESENVPTIDLVQLYLFWLNKFSRGELEVGFRFNGQFTFPDGDIDGGTFLGIYAQPTFGKKLQFGIRCNLGIFNSNKFDSKLGIQLSPTIKIRLYKS